MSSEGVTIITPIYNGAYLLNRAIWSVLRQNDDRWQLILIDDGSEDDTWMLCQAWAMLDNRIKVIHSPQNMGHPIARNFAHHIAKYSLMTYLDHDDYLSSDRVERLLAVAGSVDLIFSAYDSDDGITKPHPPRTPLIAFAHRTIGDGFIPSLTYGSDREYPARLFYQATSWVKDDGIAGKYCKRPFSQSQTRRRFCWGGEPYWHPQPNLWL